MNKDKLLEIFGVQNHAELYEFMENNPDDAKVKQLKEIIEMAKNNDRNEILKRLVTLNFASCFISGNIKDTKQIDSLSNDLDKLRINILDYIYDINYDADIKSNDKAYEYNKDMSFPKEMVSSIN